MRQYVCRGNTLYQEARCVVLLAITLVAVGVGFLVLTAPGSPKNRITIGFAGFTNYSPGAKAAIFVATNETVRAIRYSAWVEQKTAGSWPMYEGPLPQTGFYDVPGKCDFQLLVPAVSNDVPWRVSICYSVLDTKVGEARWKVAEFFYSRNLNALGRLFHGGATGQIVAGPEMTNQIGFAIP